MHITRKHLTAAFLGGLVVLAVFALAGAPLIPTDAWAAMAAAGAMPMALTGETGGDVRKALEQLTDTAKSAKQTVEEVKRAHTELDGRVTKLQEELKSGLPDAATKAAYQDAVAKVDKVEKALDKINAEVTEIAKKSANLLGGGGQQRKSLGQTAAACEALKSYSGGNLVLANIEGGLFAKAAPDPITSGAGSAGALIQPQRLPGIVSGPELPMTVRELFSSITTSSNAIEWVQEKAFTNNAAPQAGEGAAKAQSGLTFEAKTTAVKTLAHWMPASRQVLADVPQLAGLIDTKLRYGLMLKEDEQLLFGDGTGHNLLGLVPQASAFNTSGMPTVAAGAPAHTAIDYLRWAFLQVAKAGYPATFATLSLDDWAIIQMMKTNDGAYIFGTPTDGAAPRIWGKRVVESHSMDVGDFLAGSAFAATIYDREQVTVRVAEQHGNFFVENMVAILCEERLALTVERPTALVTGSLSA